MKRIVPSIWISFVFLVFSQILFTPDALSAADWRDQIRSAAGDGAVLVTEIGGNELLAVNPDKSLIPASILKIATCAAALDQLGPDYRFVTEFRLSADRDLYVIGRGDPYLVSEELARISGLLRTQGLRKIDDIILVDDYFKPEPPLSGDSPSLNPYDAYNGALRVNFNTIFVQIDRFDNVASAEPQTPLTDFARNYALKTGLRGRVRINLADDPRTGLLYAGHLLKAFLEKEGIEVSGRVLTNGTDQAEAPIVLRHHSGKPLTWLIEALFKYSSNFSANQIFLTMGAENFGPPADKSKAGRALARYLNSIGIQPEHIEEGSGLSRLNRITARQMAVVLERFQPYDKLLPLKDGIRCKTGTLTDVKSMAGYIAAENGRMFSFVIMLNNGQALTERRAEIFHLLKQTLK